VTSQALDVKIFKIMSVEKNCTLGGIIYSRCETSNGRFTTSRKSDKGGMLAGGTFEGDVVQHGVVRP
jgi:hypothetical protein